MEIADMSLSSNPHSAKLIMSEGEIRPTSAIVIYRMIFPVAPYMQAVSMDTSQNTPAMKTHKNPSNDNKLD